jgi:predicted nucleic acid-binding protein
MKLVVDTSIVAKIFIAEPDRDLAVKVFDGTIASKTLILAPSLMLFELNNVFVKNCMAGAEYDDAISELMRWIGDGHLTVRAPDEDLLRAAATIASMDTRGQGHISSFDATFHALALRENATFLTADAAYVRKTQTLIGHVILLSDFTP